MLSSSLALIFMGWFSVFNLNSLQSAELAALTSAGIKKWNNFLLTLSDYIWTDPIFLSRVLAFQRSTMIRI